MVFHDILIVIWPNKYKTQVVMNIDVVEIQNIFQFEHILCDLINNVF